MTTKLEQAARALLAHWDTPAWKYLKPTGDLMAGLREALAKQAEGVIVKTCPDGYGTITTEQAEQEPVAWLWVSEHGSERLEWEPVEDVSKWKSTPLYTHPVRTKDLTDDEIFALIKHFKFVGMTDRNIDFARAVIAADREKNRG